MPLYTQTAALSGQFSKLEMTDFLGAFQDLTQYCDQIDVTRGSDPTDITAGVAGGGRIAETIVRGAAHSEFTIKFLWDLQLVLILRQILWARAGTTVRVTTGANAIPTVGDVLFLGTMTPFTNHLVGAPGSNKLTLDVDFVPTDAGSIVIPFFATS